MLLLPEADPTDPTTLAGWVELSVLAVDDGQMSVGNAAEELRDSNLLGDILEGEEDYIDGEQERLAEQTIADVWSILEERQRLLGPSSPFILERRLIRRRERRKKLEDVVAYLTMLLLEAAGQGWYAAIKLTNSDEVRTHFEVIAAASLKGLGNTQVERLGAPFPGSDIRGLRNVSKS